MKHTQGEWKLERDHFDNHIIFCDGFHLAEIRSIADAKLMVAAPDLLEALQNALASLLALTGNPTEEWEEVKQAKAAINKATI
jgi:hypothetical protein